MPLSNWKNWPRATCWQLVLAVVLAAVVVIFYWGFSDAALASVIVEFAGYWIVGATALLFGVVWYREARARWPAGSGPRLRAHWAGLLLAVLGAGYWQVHEPHDFKVLFDEHVLAGIAYDMHYVRQGSLPSTTHLVNGRLYSIFHEVDKRPLLYPFVVSVLHDVTGYRPENSFIVNGLVGWLLLLLVYALGAAFGGWTVGCLGELLLIGLPLLAQNATGGGFDLLNATLLTAQLLAAWNYWRQPGAGGLDVWAMTAILQANCRYEGLLYLPLIPLLMALKWLRERRVTFSWCGALVPLLALLPMLNYQIFNSGGSGNHFFQTRPNQPFFSWKLYFQDNVEHAVYFLFSPARELNNSVLLSVVGLVGLVFTLVTVGCHLWRYSRQNGPELPLFLLLLGVFANSCLMWCLFWGHWEDPFVSRFSLPAYLALTWCAMYFAASLLRGRKLPGWSLVALGIYAIVSTAPVSAQAWETNDPESYQGFKWTRDYVLSHATKDTLIVTRSTLMFTLYGQPSVSIGRANASPKKLVTAQELGFYREVWVVQEYQLNGRLNAWVEMPLARLDRRVKLETIAKYPIRPEEYVRISRVVGFDPSKPAGTVLLAGEIGKNRKPGEGLQFGDYPDALPADTRHAMTVRPGDELPAIESMSELPTDSEGFDKIDRMMMQQLP